jgi:hypothetical protein
MKEIAKGKVKYLVFLDGCLMREDLDYVWKEGEPIFPHVSEGRVDVVNLGMARKDAQFDVTTYKILDTEARSTNEMVRIPMRLVVSDYQALVACISECPFEVLLADEPKSMMFGFMCNETGDSWLIRVSDMRRSGPEGAESNEFRQKLAKEHNESLKK